MSLTEAGGLSIFRLLSRVRHAFRIHPRGTLNSSGTLQHLCLLPAPRWQAGAELWTTFAR